MDGWMDGRERKSWLSTKHVEGKVEPPTDAVDAGDAVSAYFQQGILDHFSMFAMNYSHLI